MSTDKLPEVDTARGVGSVVRVSPPSKVRSLAEWLHHDIRRRGLRPGDRYLTSEEAASALSVSTGTAHQAMRLLVDQQILERTRKRGTYVGPAVEAPDLSKRQRIYVLLPADATRDGSYARLSESIYPAIAETHKGAALQLEYLPPGDNIGFVRALVQEADQAGNLGGFFLMRSTYEIQKFFQDHREYPAVIVGSRYPGITGIAAADADQTFIGTETAQRILRTGHRRVAVLLYEHWAPGDSRLMTAIAGTLVASGKVLDRLEVCSLPAYEEAIRGKLIELLSGADRPTVIIARMALQVSVVLEVAKTFGLRIPHDLELLFGNLRPQLPTGVTIPHFDAEYDLAHFSTMLAAAKIRALVDAPQMTYPVRFVDSTG